MVQMYQRGHKTRPDLHTLAAASAARHRHHLRNLPQVTAPSYDCRTLGQVGPIEDQGQCGSCWDFSGTDVCQSAMYIAGLLKNDGQTTLSRQYTLDCYSNGGCSGDDAPTVTQHAKDVGLPLTSDYGPYQAGPGRCQPTPKLYKIDNWGFCTDNNGGIGNVQDIKNCMVTYGPISSGVDASQFDSYSGGVLTGSGNNIDHDIVLVAWQDDPTVPGGGYWKLRNSWGKGWGIEGGYMNIAYGAFSVGSEALWASVNAVPPGPIPPPGPVPPPGPTPVPTPSQVVILPPRVLHGTAFNGLLPVTVNDPGGTFPVTQGQMHMMGAEAIPWALVWMIIQQGISYVCANVAMFPPSWQPIITQICGFVPHGKKPCGGC